MSYKEYYKAYSIVIIRIIIKAVIGLCFMANQPVFI